MLREMGFAGSFYPDSAEDILNMYDYFNSILQKHNVVVDIKAKAIISPHAGYIYSGFSANMAYLALKNFNPKRVIVIGVSHRVAFNGINGSKFSGYVTPFGIIDCDVEYLEELKKIFEIQDLQSVNLEHSSETQFPFIKYYLPNAKIVELVYSNENPKELAKIISYILKDSDNSIVISTDLSHFYSQKVANRVDAICIDAISKNSVDSLKECEACGKIGVSAMMEVAKKLNLKPTVLDYRTSADASGDYDRVVGYVSVAYC